MNEQQKLANIIHKTKNEALKELLTDVCLNMIKNEDYDSIAELLINELGYIEATRKILTKRRN